MIDSQASGSLHRANRRVVTEQPYREWPEGRQ